MPEPVESPVAGTLDSAMRRKRRRVVKEYQTFIVRIWADDASEVARGHIQHVRTRRTLYFKDAARMLRFIDEHLAPLKLSDPVDGTPLLENEMSNPSGDADTVDGLLRNDLGDGVFPRAGSGDAAE
ncbi:MAG TPA: hypothetical protein VFZ25_04450 [Chloroflexota bacterium]|nr:hypothetical protein [Chloroflexota bacterium]